MFHNCKFINLAITLTSMEYEILVHFLVGQPQIPSPKREGFLFTSKKL